jgi:uncharacterized cupin superfamily protein
MRRGAKSSTLIGPGDLSVTRQEFAATWAIADKMHMAAVVEMTIIDIEFAD